MNRVFGLDDQSAEHWEKCAAYSSDKIDRLRDPEGGAESRGKEGSIEDMPTAVPSPFARIDIVRTAFANIASTSELKAEIVKGPEGEDVVRASSQDERLVSHTLDLLEIVFNIDRFKDWRMDDGHTPRLRIIEWRPDQALAALEETKKPEHSRYADTLRLYLAQDAATYNFGEMGSLYLIELDTRIIGCTSPATLFFPTADPLEFAQIRLGSDDVLFDENYCPLYEREKDFQVYLHALFAAHSDLTVRMEAVNSYLERSKKIQEGRDKKFFLKLNSLPTGEYDKTTEDAEDGYRIEVLKHPLRRRKEKDLASDFFVYSKKQNIARENLPLVLKDGYSEPLRYIGDEWIWDASIRVPNCDPDRPDSRKLPKSGRKYPYLTVSDFLESYIVRLVYPINREKYFDGNITARSGGTDTGYLLPLKRRFFEYFTTDDLFSGHTKIQIDEGSVAGAVDVTLSIPITDEQHTTGPVADQTSVSPRYIVYKRTYYRLSQAGQVDLPNEEMNKGYVLEQQFGVTVLPFFRAKNEQAKIEKATNERVEGDEADDQQKEVGAFAPVYRVHLVDRDSGGVFKENEYDLVFGSNQQTDPIQVKDPVIRSLKTGKSDATSKIYSLDRDFDYIQVRSKWGWGVIVPRWKVIEQGSTEFAFAIDFGTTNTHIEYSKNGEPPKPFGIDISSAEVATLFDPIKTNESTFGVTGALSIQELPDLEMVPPSIGAGSEYRFPHRTVLAEKPGLDLEKAVQALADVNIPFTYERRADKDTVHTGLKWAKQGTGSVRRANKFIENLLILIRNKVLAEGGKLSATKIYWFYPLSMAGERKGPLQDAWTDLASAYLGDEVKPVPMPESLAPFYYYSNEGRAPIGADSPAVSIDIGGGTTDVVIFQKVPLLTTSFRFAANSVFGDGLRRSGAANQHGIVKKYGQFFEKLLKKNNLGRLSAVLSDLVSRKPAEDINAFLFSLEFNSQVKNEDEHLFSFNRYLAGDDDLRIVFIYFFAAVVYHIAKLMQIKEIALPRYLMFSGTGSKILDIISKDEKVLKSFCKAIFGKVYGEEMKTDLAIMRDPNPKEITAKGALLSNGSAEHEVDETESIWTGVDGKSSLTWESAEAVDVRQEIIDSVKSFNSMFLELAVEFDFVKRFLVSKDALAVFKTKVDSDLLDYLSEAIHYSRDQDAITNTKGEIKESLFFYPIIGAINALEMELGALNDARVN